MTENIENIENPIKIESKGTRDLILQELRIRKENQQLKKDNQILSDELSYFKEHCADLEDYIADLKKRCRELSSENMALNNEVNDMKFTRKFLTSEKAGRDFAKSLIGGA